MFFATIETFQQKIFNEINDLQVDASAAKSLIYKEIYFLTKITQRGAGLPGSPSAHIQPG